MVYDTIPQPGRFHLFARLWNVGDFSANVGIHSHLCGASSFVFVVESFPHMCYSVSVDTFLWFNVECKPKGEKDGGNEQ